MTDNEKCDDADSSDKPPRTLHDNLRILQPYLPVLNEVIGLKQGNFPLWDWIDDHIHVVYTSYGEPEYVLAFLFVTISKQVTLNSIHDVQPQFRKAQQSHFRGVAPWLNILALHTVSHASYDEWKAIADQLGEERDRTLDLLVFYGNARPPPIVYTFPLSPFAEDFWQRSRRYLFQLSSVQARLQSSKDWFTLVLNGTLKANIPFTSMSASTRDFSAKLDELLLIRQETQTLDYKVRLVLDPPSQRLEFAKDVAAFANTRGGYIVVGVEDRLKRPVGIVKEEWDEDRLQQIAADRITPGVHLATKLIQREELWFGLVRIQATRRIHYVGGRVPIRIGAITRYATEAEIQHLKRERNGQ